MDLLTNLSIFTGGGGIEKAAKWTKKIKTVCYVEIDPYAQGVLMSRIRSQEIDDAPIWDDIKTFDGTKFKGVWCVSGGFPCQDVSQVNTTGQRLGLGGARSGLWSEFKRILRETDAHCALIENVTGLVSTGGIYTVLEDLEALGYRPVPYKTSSCAVGASHTRKRVFILAYPASVRWDATTLHAGANGSSQDFPRRTRSQVGGISCGTYGGRVWGFPDSLGERNFDGVGYWVDRLRLCGNGVDPYAAFPAWEKLLMVSDRRTF
jgi:DNA (cytosine-5)-methyltransferase 1